MTKDSLPVGFYVYAYYEPDCAEPFYIGKGCKRRAWDHLRPLNLSIKDPFHCKLRSMIQAGFKPDIQILEDSLTEEESFDLEKNLIRKFGRKDIETGCLLNITDGGEGRTGRIKSEEEKERNRAKGRKALSIEHRINIGKASRERWTEEKRREVSEKMKKGSHLQRYNEAKKRPIIRKYCGKIDKRYESVSSVIKISNFSTKIILQALQGKRKLAYGYEWEYE